MKAVFVFPSVGRKPNEKYVESWKMEPLAVALLAALTPPEWELVFYDDRIEEVPFDINADLVLLSVETYTARRAYRLAEEFRRRGVPVLMGGLHPSLLPEESLQHADSVIVGDGEDTWPAVLEDLKRNRLQRMYVSGRPPFGDVLPQRHIFNGKKYLPLSLVETARGCLFDCKFCSVTAFFAKTYRLRPISAIVRDIERITHKTIFFVDDNIVMNRQRAKEFFKALIPLKIRWFSQGSIHMAEDEELLLLMKKSGCLGLLIGFESLNKDNLRQMNKPLGEGKDDYTQAIKRIREQGILIYGTFVFGYDQDDQDSFQRTVDFAMEQKFFLAAFNHLVPFPGHPFMSS